MSEEREKISFDTQLLSDAITELNVSRRNVAIYPEGHPLVKKSLNRTYELLQRLLELKKDITLAAAKDILIADNHQLDKKNPVYTELALQFSNLNIACIKFVRGLKIEEIYEFHKLLSEKPENLFQKPPQELIKQYSLTHIEIEFINYDLFVLDRDKTAKPESKASIWERYVYGLLEGTLKADNLSGVIQEIPPDILAGLLNKKMTDDIDNEVYDRFITTYVKVMPRDDFSSREVRKLIDFLSFLKPELKKQFLISAVKFASEHIDTMTKSLNDLPLDKIIELLGIINELRITLPEELENTMKKFIQPGETGLKILDFGERRIVDDYFFSQEVADLLQKNNTEVYTSGAHQKDNQDFPHTDADTAGYPDNEIKNINTSFKEEILEKEHCETLLELISYDVLTEEDYEGFLNTMKESCMLFTERGQYGEVLKILQILEKNLGENRFPRITSSVLQHLNSKEFMSLLVESFCLTGKQFMDEAIKLLGHYGEKIIPFLMEALIEEKSKDERLFLINVITGFGEKAVNTALNHLDDNRWFVSRNMLQIINECGGKEAIPHIKRYRHHTDPRVSLEALKCILKTGDHIAIATLREYLESDSSMQVEMAIKLCGEYRQKEMVPDLLRMLKKKKMTGKGLNEKILIIKTLGEIGDIQALDTLRELVSIKSLLFKGAAEKLKEEIYKTLKNYPYNAIEDMVTAGLHSKNENIRKESFELKNTADKK